MRHAARGTRPAEDHLHRRHHATRVSTDDTWQVGTGGRSAPTSLYDGETYDARLDRAGWDRPGFDGGWRSRGRAHRDDGARARPGARRSRVMQDAPARSTVTQPEPGVIDLRPRPELRRLGADHAPPAPPAPGQAPPRRGPQRRRHRSTPPTCAPPSRRTRSRSRAGGDETYEPRFTVPRLPLRRADRLPAARRRRHARPAAWSPPTCPSSARSRTSNALVNQIQTRSSGASAPTCWPSRPTAPSATSASAGPATSRPSPPPPRSTSTSSGYLGQCCRRLRDAQRADGAFTDVAPVTCCGDGTAGWGDAGMIVPYTL